MDILGIGFWELMIIFIVAMMVFGPRRLPEYAAKAGKIVRDLRNMSQGLMAEWQREITVAARLEELQEVRKELELTRQELNQSQQQISQQTQEDLKQAQEDISTIKKQVNSTTLNSPSPAKLKGSGSIATPSQEGTTNEVETVAQEDAVEEKSASPDSNEEISAPSEQPQKDATPTEAAPDTATEPDPVEVNGQNNTSSTETAAKPSKTPLEPKETIND